MTRTLLMVLALTLLIWPMAAPRVSAQDTPAQAPATPTPTQSTPATQQAPAPAADQTADEDIYGRKKKTHANDYKKWVFNVGGGANLGSGTTKTFVRGGGGLATAGVARNADKYLGLRLDFMWADLPLRTSALQLAQAPTGSNHVYGVTLGPILNIPVNEKYSGYLLAGPGFFHRSGKLDSSTAVAGSTCNAFWDWWGTCFNASLPLNKNFLNESENQFGIDVGGGVARKVWGKTEVYFEFRYIHAAHNKVTTDFKPITIGVRW